MHVRCHFCRITRRKASFPRPLQWWKGLKQTAVSVDFIFSEIAGYPSLGNGWSAEENVIAVVISLFASSMALRSNVLFEEQCRTGSSKSQEFLLHNLKHFYSPRLQPTIFKFYLLQLQ